MKTLTISSVCILCSVLGAAGARAAENAVQANDAGPVVQNSQAMAAAGMVPMRQQVQDQLLKAGYTDVTVMPSSFYIRAKDKMGNPVAMVIGPDSFAEVTDVTPKK